MNAFIYALAVFVVVLCAIALWILHTSERTHERTGEWETEMWTGKRSKWASEQAKIMTVKWLLSSSVHGIPELLFYGKLNPKMWSNCFRKCIYELCAGIVACLFYSCCAVAGGGDGDDDVF